MRKVLLSLLLLLPMAASAYVEIDGIYYILSSNNEATVTCKGTPGSSWYIVYSGDVVIPETVTFNGIIYHVTSIGETAFSGSSELTSISIPNTVTSIGYQAFSGCTGLTTIDIPNSIKMIDTYAFLECTGLTNIEIPNSVTRIGGGAFYRCNNIHNIEIPNSVAAIGGGAFDDTPWYENLYNSHPDGIIYLGSVAYNHKGAIPSSAPLIIKEGTLGIGGAAFCNHNELANIVIPNSVTTIGENAFSQTGLTSINLPDSLVTIEFGAFYGCNGLTSIELPKSVKTIGGMAFEGCKNLSNFLFSESLQSIGMQAFNGCSALTSIMIPRSISNIDDNAFYKCTGLRHIELPISLAKLGMNVFNYCNNISTLILYGEGKWQAGSLYLSSSKPTVYLDSRITSIEGISIKPIDVYSFASTPPLCDENSISDYSRTLHVPATSLAAYFTAPYWSNFANIVGDAEEPNVSISQDSVIVNLGTQINLTASVTPDNATLKTITWKSTNSYVATINNNGTVTAVGVGECDIIAQCLFNMAVCHVVVNDATVTITLDQQEIMLLPNHMLTLTANATPIIPDLNVSLSDPSVAAARVVNNKIQVVGINEGVTTITVGSVDGTAIPATCLVTVYTESGDTNCDGFVNISDVTDLIDYLLSGDSYQISTRNADVDGDGKINISDVTTLIDILLTGA